MTIAEYQEIIVNAFGIAFFWAIFFRLAVAFLKG